MNQENTGLSAVEASLRKKFQTHEWVSVKNDWNNIRSKFYIKKEFHHEHKTNFKKIRFNKRNPTKTMDYYQQYPLYKDANVFLDFNKVHDRIYQNSIPNTVNPLTPVDSKLLDHLYLRRAGQSHLQLQLHQRWAKSVGHHSGTLGYFD